MSNGHRWELSCLCCASLSGGASFGLPPDGSIWSLPGQLAGLQGPKKPPESFGFALANPCCILAFTPTVRQAWSSWWEMVCCTRSIVLGSQWRCQCWAVSRNCAHVGSPVQCLGTASRAAISWLVLDDVQAGLQLLPVGWFAFFHMGPALLGVRG